jgi:hypothetical protein
MWLMDVNYSREGAGNRKNLYNRKKPNMQKTQKGKALFFPPFPHHPSRRLRNPHDHSKPTFHFLFYSGSLILLLSHAQYILDVRFPRSATCKEGLVRLGRDLHWLLQPSLKALFITEKKDAYPKGLVFDPNCGINAFFSNR